MNMNKRLDTAIIMILLLILIGIGVSSCAAPKKSNKEASNSGIYSGAIGTLLGCVFAPNECEKYRKDSKKVDQDKITEEFNEADKQKQSESK